MGSASYSVLYHGSTPETLPLWAGESHSTLARSTVITSNAARMASSLNSLGTWWMASSRSDRSYTCIPLQISLT